MIDIWNNYCAEDCGEAEGRGYCNVRTGSCCCFEYYYGEFPWYFCGQILPILLHTELPIDFCDFSLHNT